MPSPFPGMDPYIENQSWADFHSDFMISIRQLLTPRLRPRYVARIEERVYLQHEPDVETGRGSHIKPDISIVREPGERSPPGAGTAVMTRPLRMAVVMPEEAREGFLEVRLRESHELVSVIELLSPTNKTAGSNGRREYLRKRDAVLRSAAHLVEIDLLRGGQRLPMDRPFPACDYVVVVTRSEQRPDADVWPFSLHDRLPLIPVPLAEGDPDVTLDLQEAFNITYDRAGYDYGLDYDQPVLPPLPPSEEEWSQSVLMAARSGE